MSLHVPVDRASRNEQPATRTDHSSPAAEAAAGMDSAVDALLEKRPLWGAFIDGSFKLRPGASAFDVLEAATAKPLAAVATSTSADIDSAVASARSAFDNVWASCPRASVPP